MNEGRIKLPDPEELGPEPFSGVFRPFETFIDPFRPYTRSRPPADLVDFLRWGLSDVRGPVIAFAIVAFLFGAESPDRRLGQSGHLPSKGRRLPGNLLA